MARYTGPITKKSRRLKVDLVGGDKNFEMRPFPPGQHGRRRMQEKEYLTQLSGEAEGSLLLRRHGEAVHPLLQGSRNRPGKTGDNLLQILESRLDNVIYRAGLARTRRHARQLVTHGHFEVNGVRVDVPSYRVEQFDIITIRKQSIESFPFELARQTYGERPVPAWMQVVEGTLQILIHQLPVREQIDTVLTEQLIVELYSKNV
jgi:small subunit ribosomal protein S4